MAMLIFLGEVFIISLTGALQPGPVTATAITIGTRNRWAGTLMALGHGIIEFPLIALIVLGMGEYFQIPKVRISIGLAGGAFLILMGVQTYLSLKAEVDNKPKALHGKPILAGIILSASNPYFLLWWATVGLALANQAPAEWGIWAFVFFALTHWFVDLIWLQLLSWVSSKGSNLLSQYNLNSILKGCSAAMLLFGVNFIFLSLCMIVEIIYFHFLAAYQGFV